MNPKRIYFSIITLLFSLSAFSQIDSTRRDSIEEIIIYEYDTIYIQPDTIRITDTIYDILKKDSLKVINPDASKNIDPKHPFFLKNILPKSLSFSVASFAPINPQPPSDTLSFQQTVNLAYRLGLNYHFNKYKLAIGIAYQPYHERFIGSGSYYSSNKNEATPGVYDSLQISTNYQFDYYYNYFNIDLIVGREIITHNKFCFSLNLGTSASFLMGYKQGNTNITNNLVRKNNLSFIFMPKLIYKVSKRIEFKLLPNYQYAILEDKKYPFLLKQYAGIWVGFDIIL